MSEKRSLRKDVLKKQAAKSAAKSAPKSEPVQMVVHKRNPQMKRERSKPRAIKERRPGSVEERIPVREFAPSRGERIAESDPFEREMAKVHRKMFGQGLVDLKPYSITSSHIGKYNNNLSDDRKEYERYRDQEGQGVVDDVSKLKGIPLIPKEFQPATQAQQKQSFDKAAQDIAQKKSFGTIVGDEGKAIGQTVLNVLDPAGAAKALAKIF